MSLIKELLIIACSLVQISRGVRVRDRRMLLVRAAESLLPRRHNVTPPYVSCSKKCQTKKGNIEKSQNFEKKNIFYRGLKWIKINWCCNEERQQRKLSDCIIKFIEFSQNFRIARANFLMQRKDDKTISRNMRNGNKLVTVRDDIFRDAYSTRGKLCSFFFSFFLFPLSRCGPNVV